MSGKKSCQGKLYMLTVHFECNVLELIPVLGSQPAGDRHPFNGPFSGTTRVGRYQKGKTNLDFTEARDSEWQWHQPGHMQVCTLHQTDNHASTPPLKFFTGRMPFLPPNQQHQSAEGDASQKPGGRLPLLSAKPAVTLATLKRAATNFAAW